MAKTCFSDLQVGMTSERSFVFLAERVLEFSNLVNDHAPVHSDQAFALSQGFEGQIVHGLFVQSILSGMLGNEIPGPLSVINQINMKMHSPVFIGQKVDYKLEICGLTPSVSAVSLTFQGTVDDRLIISGKAICSFPKN